MAGGGDRLREVLGAHSLVKRTTTKGDRYFDRYFEVYYSLQFKVIEQERASPLPSHACQFTLRALIG